MICYKQCLPPHSPSLPHTIVVERWGLASTLLAKDDMPTWYRKDAVPDIKGYRVEFEPEGNS